MTTINLKDFYYWYTQDQFIEVTEEVAGALRASIRYEAAYSELAARINSAPLKKSKSKRLEDAIAAKEKELAKIMRYKQALYQDWKDGEITRNDEHFLKSGKAAEQGYKACAGLTKLEQRYGKQRLEAACGKTLAYSTAPSLRTIASILKI